MTLNFVTRTEDIRVAAFDSIFFAQGKEWDVAVFMIELHPFLK